MDDFGGMAKVMPRFAFFFVLIAMASAGVPGLVGFVGEYLILFGTAHSSVLGAGKLDLFSDPIGPELIALFFVIVAATGVILGALYLLHMLQEVLFGEVRHEKNKHVKDIQAREFAYLLPIAVAAVVMGLYPQPFISSIEPSVAAVLDDVYESLHDERAHVRDAFVYVEQNRSDWRADKAHEWELVYDLAEGAESNDNGHDDAEDVHDASGH